MKREQLGANCWLLGSRLAIMAVIVLAAAADAGEHIARAPIMKLGLVVVGLTLFYVVWLLLWERSVLLHAQLLLDVAVVTAIARFSGEAASPFRVLYFLPVMLAAPRIGRRGGVVVAVAAVGGYLMLARTGIAFPGSAGGATAPGLFETGIFVFLLIVVAGLVDYLAARARSTQEELATTRSELDMANIRIFNIVHSMGSGLVLVDRQGRIACLNRAGESILGISEPKTEGRNYGDVFGTRFPAFHERIVHALEDRRTEMRAEFAIERADGVRIPIGMSTSILRDDAGEMRGVIGVFQDLTEARKMQESIRHADRLAALGEFSAGIAHEIRNPLNAIKGSIDLLRDIMSPSGDEARLIDLVAREADRLNGVIEEFLRFGRVEPGEREIVRLDTLVQQVVALARNHPSFGGSIEIDLDDLASMETYVSPSQIKQVVLNLLINAFEAIEGQGRVKVSVVAGPDIGAMGLKGGYDDEIAIVVEDTGCGINEDALETVFRPFRTTKKGGTGLGLAIVEKIVQLHDGRVAADSVPGKGSRFVVYLPAEHAGSRMELEPSWEEGADVPR